MPVLWFWRQDRRDRDAERALRDKQHQMLAEDFRNIVTENTVAMTSLRDALNERTIQCPFLAAVGSGEKMAELVKLASSAHEAPHKRGG